MKTWGKRKLSDELIRKIANLIKEIPKGTRAAAYKEMARELKCGISTIYRIQAGTLTPNDIDSSCSQKILK